MIMLMEPDQRTALVQLLLLATSRVYMPDLRDVLAQIPAQQLYVLQREVKDAIGQKLAGASVVVIESGERANYINAIKCVRESTGLGLRESRDAVDAKRVSASSFERAQELVERLRDIGVKATAQAG